MPDSSKKYIKMCAALPKGVPRNRPSTVRNLLHIQSVPLPRLEYLLKLVAEHDGNDQAIFTLQSFKLYTDQQLSARHDWGLNFSTLEQMALCYVMHEIHGMNWTGEKWEKEAQFMAELIIGEFDAGIKTYVLKVPILLKFEKLTDEGWENHIMATPLYDEDDLLGWEGIGYPSEIEAAEDFRHKLAESFQEYALADDSELSESGLELKQKLLEMVNP